MSTWDTTTYVTVEEVMQYASLKALADEERQPDQAAIIDIVVGRIAHGYDLHVEDIEVASVDIMSENRFMWGVDLVWWVPCHECDTSIDPSDMGKFSTPLCRAHYDEALAQEHADLENDDIRAGIRQP